MGQDNFVCVGQKPTRKCPAGDVVGSLTPGIVRNARVRATAAQVNAGHTVLPAIPGYKYRMIDCTLIAAGGTTDGVTGVQVKCDTTLLVDAKVAAIERNVVARAGDTDVNVLADGASFVAQAANKPITVIKDGDDLTGATYMDVIFTYSIEE